MAYYTTTFGKKASTAKGRANKFIQGNYNQANQNTRFGKNDMPFSQRDVRNNLYYESADLDSGRKVKNNEARVRSFMAEQAEYLMKDNVITYSLGGGTDYDNKIAQQALDRSFARLGLTGRLMEAGGDIAPEFQFNTGYQFQDNGLGEAIPYNWNSLEKGKSDLTDYEGAGGFNPNGKSAYTINLAGFDAGYKNYFDNEQDAINDYQFTVGHELGHALGLAHPSNIYTNNSLMGYGDGSGAPMQLRWSDSDLNTFNDYYGQFLNNNDPPPVNPPSPSPTPTPTPSPDPTPTQGPTPTPAPSPTPSPKPKKSREATSSQIFIQEPTSSSSTETSTVSQIEEPTSSTSSVSTSTSTSTTDSDTKSTVSRTASPGVKDGGYDLTQVNGSKKSAKERAATYRQNQHNINIGNVDSNLPYSQSYG